MLSDVLSPGVEVGGQSSVCPIGEAEVSSAGAAGAAGAGSSISSIWADDFCRPSLLLITTILMGSNCLVRFSCSAQWKSLWNFGGLTVALKYH